ncbi:MAG: pilus assembly protein N-terminal domain-containing protein, partial [Firmicutes bacterium]|nr:pilus assembly protein N-terminal domain-containing protein [Bacillota bacterium]
MLKRFLTVIALLGFVLCAAAEESEKVFVPLKGIVVISPGFRPGDISVTDRGVISAELIANDQIRITGLSVGKSDLHVTAGSVSKLYTVTVNDNVREVFNSLRKDLDSVPEVEISINGNRVVLKGEVSSIDGWETLLKVLPTYGSSVTDLTVFRPAPEIMLSLKKLFEKAGFRIVQDTTDLSPGSLSLQSEKNTLILQGSVYCEEDMKSIQQLISTQDWISLDGKDKSKPVRFLNRVVIKPTLLDVGAVFVGVRQAETSAVGANLVKGGVRIAQGFNFSTIFSGGTNQSYNLGADAATILNLMAESGCKRFHRAGHLSFMSNESNEYKVLHEGGTLKVR